MFFLNMPKSQNDPHGDGTAVANVTLTTANSSSGNPGVLLDILSQGSVALHGIANVATGAGLADTDGQIGADVPVTIIPTTPDEQPGDRVIVALSFVYNPKTFASNNAAADFSYLASYTYKGDTTLLVSDDHQAGGTGSRRSDQVTLTTSRVHSSPGSATHSHFRPARAFRDIRSRRTSAPASITWDGL